MNKIVERLRSFMEYEPRSYSMDIGRVTHEYL